MMEEIDTTIYIMRFMTVMCVTTLNESSFSLPKVHRNQFPPSTKALYSL